MRIELLFVEGCPNHQLARRNLDGALSRVTPSDCDVEERQVDSEEDARRWGMHGSPTILIDGRDPFARAGDEPSLSCRLYVDAASVSGAPSIEELAAALQRTGRA